MLFTLPNELMKNRRRKSFFMLSSKYHDTFQAKPNRDKLKYHLKLSNQDIDKQNEFFLSYFTKLIEKISTSNHMFIPTLIFEFFEIS